MSNWQEFIPDSCHTKEFPRCPKLAVFLVFIRLAYADVYSIMGFLIEKCVCFIKRLAWGNSMALWTANDLREVDRELIAVPRRHL